MKSLYLSLLLLLANVLFAQEIQTNPEKKEAKTVIDSVKTSENANKLDEITIYGNKKQFLKVESDKTTVSIKDNPMLSTGNAYEAVKKMPGVIASPTGGLSLNGKAITIFIDGSPSTLSGSDLESYLSSLPASAIDKAELIYNPGAAFDANASGSVINLVTNSKSMKGINASINLNYNFNKYQKPSPQILLNGKVNNLSWQTMLGYNYSDSEELSKNGQTFTSFNPNEHLDQKKLTIFTERNVYFRLGTNYKLSEKSNILFNFNTNFDNDRDVFTSSTLGTNANYINNGTANVNASNNELSLKFKTKLDTIGRTLSIVSYTNMIDRNPMSNSNGFDAITSNTNFYNNKNDFKLLNYYSKFDFDFPFEKQKFSISTGGKFNTLEVNNAGIYNFNTVIPEFIDFDYKETNLAFYAEARKKISKFSFTAGLRFENFNVNRNGTVSGVETKIDFKNNNLFPNISALYELTKDVNVNASYNRKISQPSYRSLDPNGSNFDQYNSSEGNLLLNPSIFDNYEFSISAMDFVQLGTNYTVSKNHNQFILSANPGELVSTQTFQQFDRFKTLSAYANFPIPLDYFFKGKNEFQKRMQNIDKMNYIYLSINYIKSLTDYTFSFEQKPIWNYAAQAQILLPWDVKSSLTYFILPEGGTWEIYKITKPIQQFDISLNKNFMNKKLKVGLHAFDIFNQNEINALVSSTNLQTNFFEKKDSRVFRVSLTYNFGNLKLEKENTDIQIEKVKSGGGLMK